MTHPEGRCGSCKHWTEYDGWRDPIEVHANGPDPDYHAQGQEQIRVSTLYRRCEAIEENAERYLPLIEDLPLAVARDGSAYMANVFTQAEFGCVLWAAPDG